MKLPKSSKNIYPRNEENINAIINFYFDEMPSGKLDWLYNLKNLQINQIEFLAKQARTHRGLITELMDSKTDSGENASNHLKYVYDAIHNPEANWSGSKNRLEITRKLKKYLYSL